MSYKNKCINNLSVDLDVIFDLLLLFFDWHHVHGMVETIRNYNFSNSMTI